VTCYVLGELALKEFCRRQCEILNIDSADWCDNATQVRSRLVREDLPVMIEVGRRETQEKFKFSRMVSPLSKVPDLVAVSCQALAKANEREGRGAVLWPRCLYVQP